MKFSLMFIVLSLIILFSFSLSFAEFSNYASPQLEFITNSFPGLWDKSKEDVLRTMDMFPDYTCKDYTDQLACTSRFNTNENNNIFINFFVDDYKEKHDNLWKVAVTADVQSQAEYQDLFDILWLRDLKPSHKGSEEEFSYPVVIPLMFENKTTRMVAYFPPFDPENNPFFLVEYYSK